MSYLSHLVLNRHLNADSQNSQGSAWLNIYEGFPQGLQSSCMMFVLYVDECLREINKLAIIVTLTWMIHRVCNSKSVRNRKAFSAIVAGIIKNMESIYSLYGAELSQAKSLIIRIHFRPKKFRLSGIKYVISHRILDHFREK